jgi:hypothetical protein
MYPNPILKSFFYKNLLFKLHRTGALGCWALSRQGTRSHRHWGEWALGCWVLGSSIVRIVTYFTRTNQCWTNIDIWTEYEYEYIRVPKFHQIQIWIYSGFKLLPNTNINIYSGSKFSLNMNLFVVQIFTEYEYIQVPNLSNQNQHKF